jgi:hypothetical protein
MRDLSHNDAVERWARYVKEHPDGWKREHTAFIDAQFVKHEEAVKRIQASSNGREKLIELYRIKNLEGYKDALGEN